jgi:hypothetical protein
LPVLEVPRGDIELLGLEPGVLLGDPRRAVKGPGEVVEQRGQVVAGRDGARECGVEVDRIGHRAGRYL